ncbi:TetR/AcrR family transcriptional regulator [Zavarzinia compransoris]|uniref:TetR/AcrR family transcriptional regulator n=1 Tax=Zavarzinia marina TaxID=2911065 RepID=UPI001F485538|nr:TetR/AcrR family transcriptional regulator [Zavarzinia marina]MCF4167434.1 TetR/AcrR family transcriptional regulator [Zavarzinia marina]
MTSGRDDRFPAGAPAGDAVGGGGAALVARAAAGPDLPPRALRILDAALALFADKGFDATAVPEIAAAAGVGTGTIYRHFETKEALGNAVWQRAKRDLMGALAPAFDRPAMPPPASPSPSPSDVAAAHRACFMAVWAAGCAFATTSPAAFHFLEFHHEPRFLDRQSLRLSEQSVAPIHGFIAEGQALGVLAPLSPEVMSALVWGALTGLVRHAALMNRPLDPDLVRDSGATIWRAVAAPAFANPAPAKGNLP